MSRIGHSICATCDNYICKRKPVNWVFIQEYEMGICYLVNRVDGCGASCCA